MTAVSGISDLECWQPYSGQWPQAYQSINILYCRHMPRTKREKNTTTST